MMRKKLGLDYLATMTGKEKITPEEHRKVFKKLREILNVPRVRTYDEAHIVPDDGSHDKGEHDDYTPLVAPNARRQQHRLNVPNKSTSKSVKHSLNWRHCTNWS
eukprot:TRINITY_DN5090_c0_g1_i1.p1 TRINITY_DN5090_c0_g1~~TRINITY_DN5090_c0_g1_i1.p1  ORF type:complete len:104 (+),score=9.20 TRINITY_DN5090_c0_g1_i1:302-613(+)